MIIKLILIPLLVWQIVAALTQMTQKERVISVEGNVNQSTQIIIPFQHLISVTVDDKKYQRNLVFSPNRFRLQSIKHSQPLPKQDKTLLEQLRTPFTNEYIHIFALNGSFFVFKMPNHFLVLKEQESSFVLQTQFQLTDITNRDLKFQAVNGKLVIIYLSKEEIILMRSVSYVKTNNPFETNNAVQYQNNHKLLAYFSKKLYLVQASQKQIQLKSQIILGGKYQLKDVKAMHIYDSTNSKIVWLLDKQLGLLWIKLSHDYQLKDGPLLLLQQTGCYQFDINQQSQIKILLTCASNGESFFIKSIYLYQNHKPILIKQWSPHIQPCKTKRFIFYQQHIFSLQKQSLDVFLPSIYKGQTQMFYIKNWISLAGHSAYWLQRQNDQLYIYSVNNYRISKSQLILEDYSLQIRSQVQLKGHFNLTVEYMCSNHASKVKEICTYETEVEVNLHNKSLSFIQTRSIILGIILLFLTSITAVAFICYFKYRNLEYMALHDLKSITNPTNYKL